MPNETDPEVDIIEEVDEDATETTDEEVDEPTEEVREFSEDYVRSLRKENARYRQRAKEADTLAERLHVELVRATGRLADPGDLAFAPEHLDDPEKLTAALDALLEAKPHFAARKVAGDIGQGATSTPEPTSLSAMLRARV
ncbi:hypothetical protein HUN08_13250 [Gordonia sp. X0973]|uniref:hypothetical protein n=1 Tax=Gordonia sp. X0973 TaxID=2742602 RepID=UPI000F52EF73|nr:hypothetical protein [Gordonia sp. X0973]QKT08042.1 hypothetical protein HUN08_13250 [Gordonia sp. X0973]